MMKKNNFLQKVKANRQQNEPWQEAIKRVSTESLAKGIKVALSYGIAFVVSKEILSYIKKRKITTQKI
jgi:hypothetical protein